MMTVFHYFIVVMVPSLGQFTKKKKITELKACEQVLWHVNHTLVKVLKVVTNTTTVFAQNEASAYHHQLRS